MGEGERQRLSTYSVGGSEVDPAVKHIRFVELLALTLILQAHGKVPV